MSIATHCDDDRLGKRVVVVCPEPLTVLLDRAAGHSFTTRSEYVRQAVIAKLRNDGFDPTRAKAA